MRPPATAASPGTGWWERFSANQFLKVVLSAIAFGIAYFIVQRLAAHFRFYPVDRAAIWIPGAVILTALLLAPPRTWWVYLAAFVVARVFAFRGDTIFSVGVALVTTPIMLSAAVAAAFTVRRVEPVPRIGSQRALFALFVATLLILPAGRFLSDIYVEGSAAWSFYLRSALGVALGCLIATAALLPTIAEWRLWSRQWRWIVEFTVLLCLLALVVQFSFGKGPRWHNNVALLYLPLPLLLWAAVRFELPGVSWALLLLAIQSITLAVRGRGPFGSMALGDNVLQLQFFLLAVAVPSMYLSVVMQERRHGRTALAQSEAEARRQFAQLSTVYQTAPVGLTFIDRDLRYVSINDHLAAINGLPADAHVGRTVREVLPGNLGFQLEALASRVLESGEPIVDVETRGLVPSSPSKERMWRTSYFPVRDPSGNILGVNIVVWEVTEAKRSEEALRHIAAGVSTGVGEAFFQPLVEHIRASLRVACAFVCEFPDDGCSVSRTLAACIDGKIVDNIKYDLAGTPCDEVRRSQVAVFSKGVQARFPDDLMLVELRAECYLGIRLDDAEGRPIGLMSVIGRSPMADPASAMTMLQIFAARASAELQRKKAEDGLRESEARYRSVVECQTDLICRYLGDGTLTFVNDAYCRYFGRERSRLVGRTFIEFIPEAARDAVRETIRMLTAAPAVHEHEVIREDGSIGWQQWIDVAIHSPEGTPQEFQGIGRDITERKRMEEALRSALEEVKTLKDQLHAENIYLQQELSDYMSMGDVICNSEAMRTVLANAQQVAITDTTVLLTGETGTGKEMLARAIHRNSQRAQKVLVRVNCAALPPNLIESELFGHERGAFTGAVKRHAGRFELANGGTLFLDEVGELPLELQSKLLRVLQEGEFERLGGSETRKVNVRVIAATNRDLAEAVRQGAFRADLYYRLNVFPIHVPPLRERIGEIPMLASMFLEDVAKRLGRKFDGISVEVIELLQRYPWPGNARELRNVIERAAVTTTGKRLRLPPGWDVEAKESPALQLTLMTNPVAGKLPWGMTLDQLERAYIKQVLEQTKGRITGPRGAAIILGMNPSTLRFRMQKLGIRKGDAPSSSPAVPDDDRVLRNAEQAGPDSTTDR